MIRDPDAFRFDALGDALPRFRIEASSHWDGIVARLDLPSAAVGFEDIETQPPYGYDRAMDLPRLVPAVCHWLIVLCDPDYHAPAWREWLRADLNIWVLDREAERALLNISDPKCRHLNFWMRRHRELFEAIEAERTIQRVICELESKRGKA